MMCLSSDLYSYMHFACCNLFLCFSFRKIQHYLSNISFINFEIELWESEKQNMIWTPTTSNIPIRCKWEFRYTTMQKKQVGSLQSCIWRSQIICEMTSSRDGSVTGTFKLASGPMTRKCNWISKPLVQPLSFSLLLTFI